MLPGTYTISVVGDTNKNDKWDPFDPVDFSGPEGRYVHAKQVRIKANWEHQIDFRISE